MSAIRITSYYPPGPERQSNAAPPLDRAEVEEVRRLMGNGPITRMVEEIERFEALTVEELGALRDLELWGCNPFEED